MKDRIKKLEALRDRIAYLTYRQTVEGTCDDKCGEKLETKILGFITEARLIGESNRTIEKGGSIAYKDCRAYCKKCGAVLGENIDGKPICQCEVWPMKDFLDYEYALHHDPLIRIPEIKNEMPT